MPSSQAELSELELQTEVQVVAWGASNISGGENEEGASSNGDLAPFLWTQHF